MSCETTLTDFELGDDVRVATVFKDSAGTAINPSAVYFKFTTPAGAETIYQYGVDAQLVRDSTGNYHVDIDASMLGVFRWKFYSTGSGKGADAGKFRVVSTY